MGQLNIKTRLMGKGLTISTIQESSRSFETLVFHRLTDYDSWDVARYKSESAARKGHKEMVAKWKVKSRQQIRDELTKRKG